MRQLISTIYTTALRAPGMLGEILFKELDQVVYCDTCRDAVAGRRQIDQLKFADLMLLVMLIVIALPTYMMFA